MEPCFLQGLLVHVVSNTDLSLCDEVHLKDFFFLIVDHILVLFLAEVSWFQSKGNIVQEFALLVLLGVEEEAEIVEDIVKEVMNNDSSFDRTWQCIDEIVVLLHL